MLFTSTDRYNSALKRFFETTIICKCGKKMYPYSKPFGKSQPEFRFLMAMCECGIHYKQLYEYMDLGDLKGEVK